MASLPLFRHSFQERLRAIFLPPSHVLELGELPGEDTLLLQGTGVQVDVRGPEDLRGLRPLFDGAFGGVGVLEGADLVRVGADLAAALRSGAPVLLGLRKPRPFRRPSPAQVQNELGPAFSWGAASAWGVLLPREGAWILRHPQTYGLLAVLERMVRRWPGVRGRGEILVLEGRRR